MSLTLKCGVWKKGHGAVPADPPVRPPLVTPAPSLDMAAAGSAEIRIYSKLQMCQFIKHAREKAM